MKKVIVPLAEGCEEMAAVIAIDILRRAGLRVEAVSLRKGPVRCSRDVLIVPDREWDAADLDSYDLILLPGGTGGMENLRADRRVLEALRNFAAAGKIVAAICAAPLVLQAAGLLEGRSATCHPGVAADLQAGRREERVVVDGNIVTSQGPGTAMEFALKIIELVAGAEQAKSVAEGLVL